MMARSRTWPALAAQTKAPALMLACELAVLLAALWLAGHVIDLTAFGALVKNGDVTEYRTYALSFWTVPPLLHHLPVEYPPLAIFPFSLTLLPSLPDTVDVFAVWMSAFVVLGYLWVRQAYSRERAIAYAVLLLVGANTTVLARFDLFPALATLGALLALRARRFTWAYVLLAVGILLKLYPAFLVPVAAIEHWRALHVPAPRRGRARRLLGGVMGQLRAMWRVVRAEAATQAVRQAAWGVLLCGAIVGVTFGLAALLSPAGALSGFTYASNRPLQIESTPASVLWLGTFLGFRARDVYSFHSLNYVGTLDAVLKPLSAVALAGGCLYIYWRQLRGRLDVGHALVACLCVVLVANKIFSPQYLIWVLPLVAVVDGVDWYWLLIGALTTVIYPFLYFDHSHINQVAADWRFLPVVTLRNALLLVVTVRAIRGVRGTLVPGHLPPKQSTPASTPRARRGQGGAAARQVSAGIM
jgi:Glycosyltransferase family 87